MKKLVAVYPPLVAAFPVLAIFSANLSLCPLSDLWRPLGICMAGAVLLWLVAGLLCRNSAKGAAAATVVVIACFTYAPLSNYIYGATAMPPMWFWVPLVLGLSAWAAYKWRWHTLLNVLSIALVLSSFGSILLGYGRIAQDEARMAPRVGSNASSGGNRPDIYYIILDGYGRADQVQRVMHYDDSAFVQALEQRGFYVAERSHSNYVQTELSLASSLNMEFIPNLLPSQSTSSDDRKPLDNLASRNAVANALRSMGYEYIAITSGFPSLQFDSADLLLGSSHRISLLESTLVSMTPLSLGGSIYMSEFSERRELLAAAYANLTTICTASSVKPRFVFVHVLAPHPPFVVNPDGSPKARQQKGPFGYWDGSDYFEFGNTREDYRKGYVDQLQYVNRETLAVVDKILAKPGLRPIILLQGDHGSKLGLSQNSLHDTDLPECMSNLMAYEVPEGVQAKLYPTITPVNSFRILLSTLFDAKLPSRPDRSYFSTFEQPYKFTLVPDQLLQVNPPK